MHRQLVATVVVGLMALVGSAFAADPPQQPQIILTIMSAQVNSFAPGVDAAIGLTNDQAKQLAAAYGEIFNSSAVALANMVLQDGNTTAVQRQAANATLQQAQLLFQARGRTILTPAQGQLVDKIQTAFNKVYAAAQTQMNSAVRTNFGAELEVLLSAEQKQAMYKARAEIEKASQAPAPPKPANTPAPATAPAPAKP